MTVSLFDVFRRLGRKELIRLNRSKHMLSEEKVESIAMSLEIIKLFLFSVSSRQKDLAPTLFKRSYKFFSNNLLRNNLRIL